MSFAKRVKGQELAIMMKILSIFGIVEGRQMRQFFEHLSNKQYGEIISRLTREGLVYHPPGGRYITTSRFTVEKSRIKESVQVFWAFINVRENVLDFCASSPPAILSITSGDTDFDLIPVNARTVKMLNDPDFAPSERTIRLLVVTAVDELDDVDLRAKNDYAVVVGNDGVLESYEMR